MFKAEDLVKQSIERHNNNIAVACSFGKDSMVVLHMALKINPNIRVVFEDTRVEFPETIEFKKKLKQEWNLNLIETKPIKSFWECAEQYGLPKMRKQKRKGGNSPRCCHYLKEKPALLFNKEFKVNSVITGLQACESRSRALLAKRYDNKKALYMSKQYKDETIEFCSQRWFTKNTGVWNYHPIMLWSNYDVWNYTLQNNIPINEVYLKWDIDGNINEKPYNIELKKDTQFITVNGKEPLYKRCGCLPCTAYKDWDWKLRLSHPTLWKKLNEIIKS